MPTVDAAALKRIVAILKSRFPTLKATDAIDLAVEILGTLGWPEARKAQEPTERGPYDVSPR